ncbi:MAG TPA: TetR/AcrR family transcriptional regulator [Candidatus Hydrogenedentes bacterium]|nr:TetR/AcrR family transcriptional regulator [Candidatus Hydrogenedentota bacterium]HPG67834.1 TetR/AcrR family transcriptional regulator [Candidatus Hydrogenedentota bacterium]
MSTASVPSIERILTAAERLFAQGGYHAVTTRQIAAAADMNIATVHHHVGRKHELYGLICRRLIDAEAAALDEVDRRLGDAPAGEPGAVLELLSQFLEAFVDFLGGNPFRARLYVRRWTDPVEQVDEPEPEGGSVIIAKVRDLLTMAEHRGILHPVVEPESVLRLVPWIVCGHFLLAGSDQDGYGTGPTGPEQLSALKRLLREYLKTVLAVRGVHARERKNDAGKDDRR